MRNTIFERPMFFLYAIIFVYLAICVKDFKPSTQRICEYRCAFKTILMYESEFAMFLKISSEHFLKKKTNLGKYIIVIEKTKLCLSSEMPLLAQRILTCSTQQGLS